MLHLQTGELLHAGSVFVHTLVAPRAAEEHSRAQAPAAFREQTRGQEETALACARGDLGWAAGNTSSPEQLVKPWHRLSEDAVDSPSRKGFKSCVDLMLRDVA